MITAERPSVSTKSPGAQVSRLLGQGGSSLASSRPARAAPSGPPSGSSAPSPPCSMGATPSQVGVPVSLPASAPEGPSHASVRLSTKRAKRDMGSG